MSKTSQEEIEEIINTMLTIPYTGGEQYVHNPKQVREAKAKINKLLIEAKEDLLFDLDEIDNKPWRVFRKLGELFPEQAKKYKVLQEFFEQGNGLDRLQANLNNSDGSEL